MDENADMTPADGAGADGPSPEPNPHGDAAPDWPAPVDGGNGRLARHAVLAKLSWAMVSESGEVRPHNEDYAGVYAPTIPDDAWDRGPLFIVADGMGGHAAGEVASRLAVDTMLDSWAADNPGAPATGMRTGARAANTAVCDAGMESGRKGMGTTLTALTLAGREAVIAHIGDSRAYMVRQGQTTQLTTDHSRVAELLRMRMITAEQAVNHPARSMLTRSLGAEMLVQVDIVKQGIAQGDVFVLCSDGMWDMLSRNDIAEMAGTIGSPAFPTPADSARTLVDTAIKRGATDNVTAVVVRINSDRPIPAAGPRRSFFRRGKA